VSADVLLQTHAEVAIALAGFASVIAALGRPLSSLGRQRFFALLALALIQVAGCLLPLWGLPPREHPFGSWQVLSGVLFLLTGARLWWLVILPNRELDPGERTIINPLANRITWFFGVGALILFFLNAVGVPFESSFDLYYTGLFAQLIIGFSLFADVASGN
jgi:hypothetical protein